MHAALPCHHLTRFSGCALEETAICYLSDVSAAGLHSSTRYLRMLALSSAAAQCRG